MPEPNASCTLRVDYTDDERAAWEASRGLGMERLAAAVCALAPWRGNPVQYALLLRRAFQYCRRRGLAGAGVTIVYKHQSGKPIVARYVRYDDGGVYVFCETGRPGRNGWVWDEAQGTCSIDDLPPDVAMAAIARRAEGVWPFYVDWPLP